MNVVMAWLLRAVVVWVASKAVIAGIDKSGGALTGTTPGQLSPDDHELARQRRAPQNPR